MKKLMLLVTVAMAAFASNAMSVDWKYTGTSAQNGYTVYVILGSTAQTSWESVDAVQAAAKDSGTIKKVGTAYNTDGSIADASITKTAANYYYVLVNNDTPQKYQVSAVIDAASKVYDPSNQESSTGKFNTNNTAASWGAAQSFSGGGTTDAPEPTSGLLLLVGAGMLALRRKQK